MSHIYNTLSYLPPFLCWLSLSTRLRSFSFYSHFLIPFSIYSLSPSFHFFTQPPFLHTTISPLLLLSQLSIIVTLLKERCKRYVEEGREDGRLNSLHPWGGDERERNFTQTALHSTALLHCTATALLHCTDIASYYTLLHSATITRYCTKLYCPVLCSVVHYTVLYYTVLHSTVQHSHYTVHILH